MYEYLQRHFGELRILEIKAKKMKQKKSYKLYTSDITDISTIQDKEKFSFEITNIFKQMKLLKSFRIDKIIFSKKIATVYIINFNNK